MDIPALERFLAEEFPQANALGFSLLALEQGSITLGLTASDSHLRPGGTVSGPTLMGLADAATYLLILANIGPKALAVTTHLSMHFMRKPDPGTLRCVARLMKLGSRLAVAEVHIHGGDASAPFAHATVTYSIPPR
ncbi:MAG: PaaI family thioesterase [Myxococcales bacterium]|nr:PaaI family thioesterase [Myxococcales bacterium]MCB9524647.1 PaaI family thioesterase [Myxococcales bacterium]